MKYYKNFIVEGRAEYGYTQSDFAKIIGISKNALSKIERCESIPSLSNALKIARALNLDVEDIFYFKD